MIIIYFITLLVCIINASKKECNHERNTNIFKNINQVNNLFHKNSYISNDENRCNKVTRENYIKNLCENEIECVGIYCNLQYNVQIPSPVGRSPFSGYIPTSVRWSPFSGYIPRAREGITEYKNELSECINSWKYNSISNSYQVEHIIDKSNTPYDNCNTDITGNIIMAYGLWNQKIGQLCWNDVVKEKKVVYGDEILCSAIKNVIHCSQNNIKYINCNTSIPEYCVNMNYDLSNSNIIKVIFVILFAICLGFFVFFIVKCK